MAKLSCVNGFQKLACLRVRVKKDHIMKGVVGDGHACAIALALKAAGATDVSVGNEAISANGVIFDTPKNISAFISKWDDRADPGNYNGDDNENKRLAKKAKRKFKPFTLELHKVLT